MPDYKLLTAGDTALVVEFGERVDRQLSTFVLSLAQRLNEAGIPGITETVPTFRSLMVHYDPMLISAAALVARIHTAVQDLRIAESPGRLWRLPVCYDPALALDLSEVSGICGGDVPPELVMSRRETPRPRVPAGAVAIATTMSCVFPRESPTGWHVIGGCPVAVWRRRTLTGTGVGPLLAPGDKVMFSPISLREYERLTAQAADGELSIVPADEVAGEAA
jgi:inhibitor of KinA